jgi:hypothetical protein
MPMSLNEIEYIYTVIAKLYWWFKWVFMLNVLNGTDHTYMVTARLRMMF